MAVDFRGHPMFAPGFNSPTRFEADVYDCEVWGQIPTDIEGTFYRVQCDFQYRPPQNEWPTGFNGDGHVSAFRFANGSVDFKARYVKTERLMAERRARKRLVGRVSQSLHRRSVGRQHRPRRGEHAYLLARRQDARAQRGRAAVSHRSVFARDARPLGFPRQVDGHEHVGASEDRPVDRRDDRVRLSGEGRSVRRHRRLHGQPARPHRQRGVAEVAVPRDHSRHRDHAEVRHDSGHLAHDEPRALAKRRADVGMEGRLADDGRRAAARRRREGRALVQGPVAQHAAFPERERRRQQDHDGAAGVRRGALAVAHQALDVRHELARTTRSARKSSRARTACSRAWTIAICRCRTATASSATTTPSGRTTRRPAATARGASRTATSVSISQNPTAPESTFFVGNVQSLQECRVRAAQGQHRGRRRLHHGRREQLRRDGDRSCTSSMRSAWKRARSPS